MLYHWHTVYFLQMTSYPHKPNYAFILYYIVYKCNSKCQAIIVLNRKSDVTF